MQGKRGQRRVWALSDSTGVAYFAVPPPGSPGLDPGPVGATGSAWRVGVERPAEAHPPPTVSAISVQAIVAWWESEKHGSPLSGFASSGLTLGQGAIAAAHALLRCGSWRSASTILQQFILKSTDEDGKQSTSNSTDVGTALVQLGLIAVQYEWDLAAAAEWFHAARLLHAPSTLSLDSEDYLEASALLAVTLSAGGFLPHAVGLMHPVSSKTITAIKAALARMMAHSPSVSAVDDVTSEDCIGCAMAAVLEASASHLAVFLGPTVGFNHRPFTLSQALEDITSQERTDMILAHRVATMEPIGVITPLADALLQLSSVLSGLGDQRSSRTHVLTALDVLLGGRIADRRVAGSGTVVDTTAVARGPADARVLREALLALVPSVLQDSDDARAWQLQPSTALSSCMAGDCGGLALGALERMLRALGPYHRPGAAPAASSWHGVLAHGALDLGTRWHFLLAYFGADTHDVMRAAGAAQYHLAPALAFSAVSSRQRRRGGEKATFSSDSDDGLHVGFLSGHWRFHSVGRLLSGVVAALARDQRFRTTIIHSAPRSK